MQEEQITPELMSLLRSAWSDEDVAEAANLTLLDVLSLRALVATKPLNVRRGGTSH